MNEQITEVEDDDGYIAGVGLPRSPPKAMNRLAKCRYGETGHGEYDAASDLLRGARCSARSLWLSTAELRGVQNRQCRLEPACLRHPLSSRAGIWSRGVWTTELSSMPGRHDHGIADATIAGLSPNTPSGSRIRPDRPRPGIRPSSTACGMGDPGRRHRSYGRGRRMLVEPFAGGHLEDNQSVGPRL